MRKGWDQAHLGFKYGETSRFAAYQGTRQIEAAVRSGEQLVEVVARNAARNRNVALSNVLCVPISQRLELRIYLAFAATTFYRQLHLLFVCPPKCQACAIVEQDLHLHHVVNRFPRGLRVHPTRIIAKHSAKGAMGVRCRVGTPGKSPSPSTLLLSSAARSRHSSCGFSVFASCDPIACAWTLPLKAFG